MNSKPEGIMAIVAAFLILISAMLAPLVSALVSLVALATFGILKLMSKNKPNPNRLYGPPQMSKM